MRPTRPAAATAVMWPGNISWLIAEACPRTPMPAVGVEKEHNPDQPELRGLDGLIQRSTSFFVISLVAVAGGT